MLFFGSELKVDKLTVHIGTPAYPNANVGENPTLAVPRGLSILRDNFLTHNKPGFNISLFTGNDTDLNTLFLDHGLRCPSDQASIETCRASIIRHLLSGACMHPSNVTNVGCIQASDGFGSALEIASALLGELSNPCLTVTQLPTKNLIEIVSVFNIPCRNTTHLRRDLRQKLITRKLLLENSKNLPILSVSDLLRDTAAGPRIR